MSKTIEELEERLEVLKNHRDAALERRKQASARACEASDEAKEAFAAWQRAETMVDMAYSEYWEAHRNKAKKTTEDTP